MKRLWTIVAASVVLGVTALVLANNSVPEKRPWKTTDVWYHESDVALVGRSARPQLVEFFHPD